MLNKKTQFFILSATVASLLAAVSACAPGHDKPARYARIQRGQKAVVTPAHAPNESAAETRRLGLSSAEIKTKLCRITEDPALTAEQLTQSLCEAIIVKTNESGLIAYNQKHSLENFAAKLFKSEEIIMSGTQVKAEHISLSRQDVSNILYLAYELPDARSRIDFSSLKVSIKSEGQTQTIDAKDLEKIEPLAQQNVIIRLKNPSQIQNINFKLTIEYSLIAPASEVQR